MRIEDMLAATRTGLWRWDNETGLSTLDATAARLLELPPEPTTLREDDLRNRFHPVDYAELHNIAALVATEGTVAQILMRVVAADGSVARYVRIRMAPADQSVDPETDLRGLVLYGLIAETPRPSRAGSGEDFEGPLNDEGTGPLSAAPPRRPPPSGPPKRWVHRSGTSCGGRARRS